MEIKADLGIYGGTSGGVVAALAAARAGRTVILIETGRHLGGMTSGGLGWVDFGRKESIGGLSREFFHQVAAHYAESGETEAQGAGWTPEPHVAEQLFEEWAAHRNIRVVREHRLSGAQKDGARIVAITLDHAPTDDLNAPVGAVAQPAAVRVEAAMWIDASYEGDLMALASVSSTTRRESREAHGESMAGVIYGCYQDWKGNWISDGEAPKPLPADPFRIAGDACSGLLPQLETAAPPRRGEASDAPQAFNFRLCLTDDPANCITIEPPPDYDPQEFELLGRLLAARQKSGERVNETDFHKSPWGVFKLSPLPHRKCDNNNGGLFSTDFVGGNLGYVEGDWATRGRIWRAHERYQRGFWHFVSTDERVPDLVRETARNWGLCRDEFPDTRGWSPQLYVRESRRMLGDYVMTQHDASEQRACADAVGMGSYSLDSHLCRRFVHEGRVINEGGFLTRLRGAYQIPYRALTPRASECNNLLVIFCLSSTHAAYSSLRMEPVLILLGEAAALAACLALETNRGVQSVDTVRLQQVLRDAGQVLEL